MLMLYSLSKAVVSLGAFTAVIVFCGSFSAKQVVAQEKHKIPDKLVVLTFDDSAKSHFTVVSPILLKYGFKATFFITEGWDFATNKKDYMSWAEISQLHQDGFEIGNHTRDHLAITEKNYEQLHEQLEAIEKRCEENQISKPVSFAWPGNARTEKAFGILKEHGILFARRGGEPEFNYESGKGVAYEAGLDHSYLLPSAGDARPSWELSNFVTAVSQAKDGKIAILQFHGVPDTAHGWVSCPKERFEGFMRYLAMNQYQVVALRDLQQFVDVDQQPEDPQAVVRERMKK